jgi:hypothetical protein
MKATKLVRFTTQLNRRNDMTTTIKLKQRYTITVTRAISNALGTPEPSDKVCPKHIDNALELLNSGKFGVKGWRDMLLAATCSRGYNLFEEVDCADYLDTFCR